MDSFRRNPSRFPVGGGSGGRHRALQALLSAYSWLFTQGLSGARDHLQSLGSKSGWPRASCTVSLASQFPLLPRNQSFLTKEHSHSGLAPTELGFLGGQYCGVQDKESHSLLVPGRERRAKGSVYLGVRSDLKLRSN